MKEQEVTNMLKAKNTNLFRFDESNLKSMVYYISCIKNMLYSKDEKNHGFYSVCSIQFSHFRS